VDPARAERRVLPMELQVGDRLTHERDRHRVGSARDAAGGVRGAGQRGGFGDRFPAAEVLIGAAAVDLFEVFVDDRA